MKLTLLTLFTCILFTVGRGQAKDSIYTSLTSNMTISSEAQGNERGLTLATRVYNDSAHWVIVKPDSLMAYYRRQEYQSKTRYYSVCKDYNQLVKKYNKLRKMFLDHLDNDKKLRSDIMATIKHPK